MSTFGKAKAVDDTVAIKSTLGEAGDIASQYTLKKIEAKNGRILATLECKPKTVSLAAKTVPDELVNIANQQITLKSKALSGDLSDEVVVDVEKGAVVHEKRIVNAKMVYGLNLPEGVPDFIRKMAGNEVTLLGKFTIETVLIDEAQAKVLSGGHASPEALKALKERWEKRSGESDVFMKDLATAVLSTLERPAKAKPAAEEF
jgi:hypothetical protein